MPRRYTKEFAGWSFWLLHNGRSTKSRYIYTCGKLEAPIFWKEKWCFLWIITRYFSGQRISAKKPMLGRRVKKGNAEPYVWITYNEVTLQIYYSWLDCCFRSWKELMMLLTPIESWACRLGRNVSLGCTPKIDQRLVFSAQISIVFFCAKMRIFGYLAGLP